MPAVVGILSEEIGVDVEIVGCKSRANPEGCGADLPGQVDPLTPDQRLDPRLCARDGKRRLTESGEQPGIAATGS